jgi:diketogulonate reductase-like aldo/keto reductase
MLIIKIFENSYFNPEPQATSPGQLHSAAHGHLLRLSIHAADVLLIHWKPELDAWEFFLAFFWP